MEPTGDSGRFRRTKTAQLLLLQPGVHGQIVRAGWLRGVDD
jgi:hypothetical protein